MKKRALSLFLALAMIFSMLPVTTWAAETELSWSGGTITLAPDTMVGTVPVTQLFVYKQNASSTHPTITSVTQDGYTINITLAEDTDPNYPIQMGFGVKSGYPQNVGNTCTLADGRGTATVKLQHKPAAAPNAPVTAEVTFTINFLVPMGEACDITAPTGEGFVFNGSGSAYVGKEYKFQITVEEGYDGSEMVVKANGEIVDAIDGIYTVTGVAEGIEITVDGIVKKPVSEVTLTEGEGYAISSTQTAYKNENFYFMVTADSANFKTAGMKVMLDGETELTGENGTYCFVPEKDAHEITVVGIEKKTVYTVAKPELEGVTVTGADTVLEADPYTFSVAVDDAYDASNMVVSVNGEAVVLTKGSYTVETAIEDITIEITGVVKKNIAEVTLTEGEGYAISSSDTAYIGESYTFTVTPDSKLYKTAEMQVLLDGETELSGENGTYSFVPENATHVITVVGIEKKEEYTVTKPEVEGVTISGADTVLETDSYTFTVSVGEGFNASAMVVAVNGEPVEGNNGSYTIENVSENLEITVTGVAAMIACKVTAPEGLGYVFNGAETVYEGNDYTFTVTANVGYTVTVLVNNEEITGSNGTYTVEDVSGNLVITVNAQRAPLPEKELVVTDNVIDITDRKFASLSSYHATATNIKIEGVDVKEAYEDGTNVYIILAEETADNAALTITFGTSFKGLTVSGHTGTAVLNQGDGAVQMKLDGKLGSSSRGSATYNLVFFRYIPSSEPPVCVQQEATVECWRYRSVSFDLSDYFEDAEVYYLVNGEAKTQLEDKNFTYVPTEAGEQELVFAAANRNGECADVLTLTLSVSDVEGGIYLGHTTSNGSLDQVYFTDGEGNLIDGIELAYENKKITVVLPMDFALDGTVVANFSRTTNGEYPRLSSSSAFNQGDGSWSDVYTNKLSNGFATRNCYLYNSKPMATTNSYETFVISYSVKNELPVLAEGVEATAEATITAGNFYTLDLAPLFTDADGDPLTYFVSIGGGAAVAADVNYSYTIDTAGEYTLVFTAHDGRSSSVETYTVNLTVENMAETSAVTVYVPEDVDPQFYVCTGFDGNGVDILGADVEAVAGEATEGMTVYTLNYPSNAKQLSVRSDAWGGMAFAVEPDAVVTLRQVQTSAVDYYNQVAEFTDAVTYGGKNVVKGTEGWLLVTGQEYNVTAIPADIGLAQKVVTVVPEAGSGIYTIEFSLEMSNPYTITVTTGAVAKLYKNNKYYDSAEYDAKIIRDNGDGTTTYFFAADSKASGMIYHVSMDGKITKAGWPAWGNQNLTVLHTDEDLASDYRLDDYSGTGQNNSAINEDNVLLNINSRNFLKLNVGGTKTLKAYRAWEVIPQSYNNYIVSPNFTYTVLTGEDVVSLTPKASLSTTDTDWMTLTANKEGIAIIEVTYDAMIVSGGGFDGIYGASDPSRTGLVVVQVGGTEDATVDFGIDCFTSAGKSGSANITYNPGAKRVWDAEFDTLYFTGDSGELSLKPTADSAITEVAVSNDKGESWDVLSGEDGAYTATIVPGNNILRVTTEAGTNYQVVRGDKITVQVKEVDGSSDGDGIVEAGEKIRVNLVGLHTPIPKMAGNYNPGFTGNYDGYSSVHLNYNVGGELVYGPGAQYNFITTANYVEVTVPENATSITLEDGYIGVGVLGLTQFTTGGDSHRNIPDEGCVTRDSKTTFHTRSILPEIVIEMGGETAPNQAPIVNADAVTEKTIQEGKKYAINPETLFTDPDGDTMTFTISVNGGEAEEALVSYKFGPVDAGVYTLTFVATDGEFTAEHTITVTVESAQTEPTEPSEPEVTEPIDPSEPEETEPTEPEVTEPTDPSEPEETEPTEPSKPNANDFGLDEADVVGYAKVSFVDYGIRVEGEKGLLFPEPLGVIVPETLVPFKKGDSVAQVTIRLLDYCGIGYEYSGAVESGFYLGAIKNFEVDDTEYEIMGEFDAGVGSGWMITQNGVFIAGPRCTTVITLKASTTSTNLTAVENPAGCIK